MAHFVEFCSYYSIPCPDTDFKMFFSKNFPILSIKDYVFEGSCPFPPLGLRPRPHSGLWAAGASDSAWKLFLSFLLSPKHAGVFSNFALISKFLLFNQFGARYILVGSVITIFGRSNSLAKDLNF